MVSKRTQTEMMTREEDGKENGDEDEDKDEDRNDEGRGREAKWRQG